jgi:hypothetical protein
MKPFPAKHELIGLFECDPEVTDPGVDWFYNHLKFSYAKRQDTLVCEIEPASGMIDITWSASGEILGVYRLRRVAGLRITMSPGEECLVAIFKDSFVEEFILWTKPRVHIQWGLAEF